MPERMMKMLFWWLSIACVAMAQTAAFAIADAPKTDQFSALLFGPAAGQGPQLAVRWTGDPSARLSAWVDIDRSDQGSVETRTLILDGALLDEELKIFPVSVPTRSLDQDRAVTMELSLRREGQPPHRWRERVELVEGIGGRESTDLRQLAKRSARASDDGCTWSPEFYRPGPSARVLATAVFDDGSGPALFIGGAFEAIGDRRFNFVAKWDGEAWSALGSGTDDQVEILTVYDDGSGPALIAGGRFATAGGVETGRLARWDGTAWEALPSGVVVRGLTDLTVHDGGSRPALVAAGRFELSGDETHHSIVQWDGERWSSLAPALDGADVYALVSYDDGNGTILVAGGDFDSLGGEPASKVARWDGVRWSALGSGISGNRVTALATYDDGDGPVLVAGGWIWVEGSSIARWDGTSWSSVGSGLFSEVIEVLYAYDDGSGPVLIVGGLVQPGLVGTEGGIAKWDGTDWSPLAGGLGHVGYARSLVEYDDGSGPALVVGGSFMSAGGVTHADHLARWDGSSWDRVDPSSTGQGINGRVESLWIYDPGTGPVLVASGTFTSAGDQATDHLAQWDGERWSSLGSGPGGYAHAMTTYDAGDGPRLVVGGRFSEFGGGVGNNIAQWDGERWSPLGSGMGGEVLALAVFETDDGPVLVAGGRFVSAGGQPVDQIAQWDGDAWSPLGSGVDSTVHALVVHDGGDGPVLVAGGEFTTAGDVPANRIAQWDGASWAPVGSGVASTVHALASLPSDGGPRLVAGGDFDYAGSSGDPPVAVWDGASWASLGSGLIGSVRSLAVRDLGHRSVLLAGGYIAEAGGLPTQGVARWDGSTWSALGAGLRGSANAFASFRDAGGWGVFVGGEFQVAGGEPSSRVGLYQCPEASPSLALSLTNSTDEIVAGGTVTYSLQIENDGRVDLTSIPLSVDFPAPLASCRWRSSGAADAAGHSSGAGSALDQTLDLPAGSSARYVISCAVPATARGSIRLEASALFPGSSASATVVVDEDPIVDRTNISTLILAHPGRMLEPTGALSADLETLMARLDDFASHAGVAGLVIDVGYHPDVAELYAIWDEDVADGASDPRVANRVLFGCERTLQCGTERDGLHDLVRSVLSSHPEIEYLILVGDDRVFPMARIPDFTDFPREIDYTDFGSFTPDLSPTRTTVGQALARNRYLSDDPIGVRGAFDAGELERPYLLLRPDLAVGRLVETPSEVLRSLDIFLDTNGRVDLTELSPDHRVLVTGYDFLVDSARRIHDMWQKRFGLPDGYADRTPLDGQLIGRRWGLDSAVEREAALLEHWTGDGAGAYRIMSLNGHANHYEEGVPGENVDDIQGLSTTEIAAEDPALAGEGSLIYAVGCHGGLPVPGSDPTDVDRSLDLPQTLLGQGALAYLANSGFGWGLLHGVGYSEKMVTLFTEELTRAGTVTLGEAVLRTKQRYYLEDSFFGFKDIKTSLQWVLFGFPMVKIETGLAEAGGLGAEGGEGPRTEAGGQETECVYLDLPDHLECKAELNGMSDHGSFVKYRASGEVVPAGVTGCPDPIDEEEPTGCYYALNGLTTTEEGWPIEPILIEDSRRAGTSQHGVLWTGGRYQEERDWVPVLAEPISSGGPVDVSASLPKTTFIRPRGRVSGGGPLAGTEPCSPADTELNTLVFAPAELIHDAAFEPTIHRLHDVVSLEIFYFNNDEDGFGNCDRLGPEIMEGPLHALDGDTIVFSIEATDDFSDGEEKDGVWRVVVVWDDETEDQWRPLDLSYDGMSGRWIGELVRPVGQDRIVYFVQAVDRRGNVSWVSYQAPGASVRVDPADGEPGLPLPIEVGFSPSSIFEDGFETGNTSRWASGR